MKQLDGVGNNSAKRFVDFLNNKCGLQTKIDPNPSIALGACEISLFEMMQAYSMFPGRGFNVKPIFISRIEDKNGNTIQNFLPQRKEVISDVTAYSVIKMMQGVMQFGTGRSIANYDIQGEIAGKTGTTNDNSDAWFMGYTPQLLCGAWVGNDDRFIRIKSTTLGQGSQAAMPIWAYFYEKVLRDKNIVGIDPNATFIKPELMKEDINFDIINKIAPTLGAEGADQGNGTSSDYGGEIPKDIKPTSGLKAESELPTQDEDPALNKTDKPKSKSVPQNNNKPAATLTTEGKEQQPKAVMKKKP